MKKAIEILEKIAKGNKELYEHYKHFSEQITLKPKWRTEAQKECVRYYTKWQQTEYCISVLKQYHEKEQENTIYELIDVLRNEELSYKALQIKNEEDAKERKTTEWKMFHYGKADAYGLIISSLEKIINKYNGKEL